MPNKILPTINFLKIYRQYRLVVVVFLLSNSGFYFYMFKINIFLT